MNKTQSDLIYELNEISLQISRLNETIPEYYNSKLNFAKEMEIEDEHSYKGKQAIECYNRIDNKVSKLKHELTDLNLQLEQLVNKIPNAKGGKNKTRNKRKGFRKTRKNDVRNS